MRSRKIGRRGPPENCDQLLARAGQDPLPCKASLPADKNSCPKSPFLERLRTQASRLTQDAPAAAVGTASPYPSWRTVRTPSSASRASEKRSLLSLGMEIVRAGRRRLGIGGNRHRTQNHCRSGQRHREFSHALPPTRKPHAAETIVDALPLYLQAHRVWAVANVTDCDGWCWSQRGKARAKFSF
jgi:hypothetical protein